MQLFWIIILLMGLLARNLFSQELDPILYQCWDHLKSSQQDRNPLVYCSTNRDNLTMCPEKLLYDSENFRDRLFVRMINVKNLNKAFNYVCSKLDGMGKLNDTCLMESWDSIKTNSPDESTGCIDDVIVRFYNKLRTCNQKDAFLFSKALTMVQSPSCTVSSYHYNLRPFYGPEIHCYPKIFKLPNTTAIKLGPIYEHFCDGFKKENVSYCIENVLYSERSNNYDDEYVKEAVEFFRRRSDFCEYLSNTTHKTCPNVDVISCQKDLFQKDALQKPFDVLLKNYSNCVYDKYKTCDIALAKIIKYNLDDDKNNSDGTKGNAAHPSISFVLILSLIGIILSLFF